MKNDVAAAQEVQKDEQVVQKDEEMKKEEGAEDKPEMIKRVGQIMNEDGEWEEYVEEEPVNKPKIAYTRMGDDICSIEPGQEYVDFCMQYRIPKIEGLDQCKSLKVSFTHFH